MTNRKPNHTCDCGKDFYVKPFFLKKSVSGKAYCSQECYGLSCRKIKKCPVCDSDILSGTNRITCSRACSNKHRTSINRDKIGRPIRDKAKTFRIIKERIISQRGPKCEECGYNRYIEALHLHHIIERSKGGSDEENNLKLLCPTCHAETHIIMKNTPKSK